MFGSENQRAKLEKHHLHLDFRWNFGGFPFPFLQNGSFFSAVQIGLFVRSLSIRLNHKFPQIPRYLGPWDAKNPISQ